MPLRTKSCVVVPPFVTTTEADAGLKKLCDADAVAVYVPGGTWRA